MTHNKLMILSVLFTTLTYNINAQTWIGAGADNSWSTEENWDSSAPVSSSTTDLIFDGVTRLTPNNDISDPFILRDITFDSGAGEFILSGDDISIWGNIVNNSSHAQTFENDLILEQDSIWNASSGNIIVNSNLHGDNFKLTKSGSESLTFKNSSGSITNLDINAGIFVVDNGILSSGWANNESLFSGINSSLIITNGATFSVLPQLSSDYSLYGQEDCSIIVSGAGSKWVHGSSAIRLDGGRDSLTVSDGAMVTNVNRIFVGYKAGNDENILTITNGGTLYLENASANHLGYATHSNTIVIAGTDDEGNRATLDMGNSSSSFVLGYYGGDYNKLIVSSGGAINNGKFNLGTYSGAYSNEVILKDGAKVTTSAGSIIGFHSCYSTLRVEGCDPKTGEPTFFSVGGKLRAGTGNDANFNKIIIDGAIVTNLTGLGVADNGTTTGNKGIIANNSKIYLNKTATTSIGTGSGSYSNSLTVANSYIQGGNFGTIRIGMQLNTTSNLLTFTDNSLWNINRAVFLRIGSDTSGSKYNGLVIDNGSVATNGIVPNLELGKLITNDNNFLIVTNNSEIYMQVSVMNIGCDEVTPGGNSNRFVIGGGSVNITGNTYLGSGSVNNQLTVYETGVYNAGDDLNDYLFIGTANGTNNIVNINAGGLMTAYNIIVGSEAGINNQISLNGGTLDVYNLLVTNDNNYVDFNSGLLICNTSDIDNNEAFVVGDGSNQADYRLAGGTHSAAEGLTISYNGILSGEGTFSSDITVNGTVSPGDSTSAGTLELSNDVTLNDNAILQFNIGGTAQGTTYDLLNISQPIHLNESTLKVSLMNGFTPTKDDVFTVITSSGISGTFDNLRSGYVTLENGQGSFEVTINNNSIILSNWSPSTRGSVIYIN